MRAQACKCAPWQYSFQVLKNQSSVFYPSIYLGDPSVRDSSPGRTLSSLASCRFQNSAAQSRKQASTPSYPAPIRPRTDSNFAIPAATGHSNLNAKPLVKVRGSTHNPAQTPLTALSARIAAVVQARPCLLVAEAGFLEESEVESPVVYLTGW